MSDSQKLSSAGRLLTETTRVRKAYQQNDQPVHSTLQQVFGPGPEKLGRGLASFARLVGEVKGDLASLEIEDKRAQKYRETLSTVETIVAPSQFNVGTHKLLTQQFPEIVLERLEALDELLIARGVFKTVETHRAELVRQELADLVAAIQESEPTEIDPFLLDQFSELGFVLDNYVLYGPEGVDRAIALIIGGGLIHAARLNKPESKRVINRMKSVGRVAKGVLDAFVYTHAGFEALGWAGETFIAFGEAIDGNPDAGSENANAA